MPAYGYDLRIKKIVKTKKEHGMRNLIILLLCMITLVSCSRAGRHATSLSSDSAHHAELYALYDQLDSAEIDAAEEDICKMMSRDKAIAKNEPSAAIEELQAHYLVLTEIRQKRSKQP